MRVGRKSIQSLASELVDDPLEALLLTFKAQRWIDIAEGRIDPEPGEVLPREVWHARDRAAQADRQAA